MSVDRCHTTIYIPVADAIQVEHPIYTYKLSRISSGFVNHSGVSEVCQERGISLKKVISEPLRHPASTQAPSQKPSVMTMTSLLTCWRWRLPLVNISPPPSRTSAQMVVSLRRLAAGAASLQDIGRSVASKIAGHLEPCTMPCSDGGVSVVRSVLVT